MAQKNLALLALICLIFQANSQSAFAQGFFRGLRDAVEETVRGAGHITKEAVDATVDTVDEVTDSPSSVPRRSQPSTSTGHYPAQVTIDSSSTSAYADAQIAQPDPKAPPATFKFGGHDWESGDKNAPIMGVSVPVPIPDRAQILEAEVPGPPRQDEIPVPKALAAQISQQLHGAGASAVIGGKRKNGFPVAGETYVKISGVEYRFRPDGSWCSGCSADPKDSFRAGSVILTAGKFYKLSPAMKWQYLQ
ncbi:MAG: hypothetical protein K2Y22_12020 [Candidatus Obscuribacterales bacterium]|nr:hypothetical protein [Candidatus Obscuribacterales bacterium]